MKILLWRKTYNSGPALRRSWPAIWAEQQIRRKKWFSFIFYRDVAKGGRCVGVSHPHILHLSAFRRHFRKFHRGSSHGKKIKNLWRRKYVRRAIFRNVEVRVDGKPRSHRNANRMRTRHSKMMRTFDVDVFLRRGKQHSAVWRTFGEQPNAIRRLSVHQREFVYNTFM